MSPRHRRLLELLADARTQASLSQVELAKRLARPQSWVSKVESGERRLDVIEFIELCEALGADAMGLLAKVSAGRRS